MRLESMDMTPEYIYKFISLALIIGGWVVVYV